MSDRPDDFVEWAHVEDIASIPLSLMGAGDHAIKIARLALTTRAEVQELRAEVERLTNEHVEELKGFAFAMNSLIAERALADQLAEALGYMKPGNRSFGDRMAHAALAAWEAARR